MHKSVTIYCVLTWWLLVQCKTTKKVNPPAVHHNEYEVVDFMQAVSLKNKKEMAQQTVSSKQSEVKERKGTQHKKTINKTTHTKGNIVEAAKRDASGQAVVQFLDGLAHNTQTVTSFGNCAVTKQSTSTDCKAEYKPNGDCSFLAAFQGIFKDLSQEKMAKFMRAGMSRNIIQGNKFKITANSKIKITTCDNRKKLILYGFGADSVSPLPWLTLRAVTMKRAFVFYEDMANKDNVEDWTGLGFAGSATTDLSGGDARVKILKELKRNQGGDADVVLSIDTERNDITVVHFLTWLGQDVSSLYPETGIDASVMEIDTTHVEKGDGPLVKVILGNENLWEAFVTGKARGSSLLENADKFFVYCKNGDMDRISQVACAVLAKFTPGSFQWGLTTSGFDVDASALTRPILEAMKESGALLFQSSRDGFQTVADEEVEKEISPYAHAVENGKNVVTEYEASPEMCVRFRLNNFQTKFPEFESKEPLNTLIAHVCPFRQEVRLHLPKIAANDVAKYSSLTMLVVRDIPGPEFGIRNNAYVKIKNIVIRRTEVCQSFTLDGKYQMLNKEGALEIKDITFKQCYDGSIWSLSGNGKETILNAQADVQVIQKSTRFAITGTLNIFDAKMIQEQTGTSYLKPALQSDLINLMEFPMSDLRFEAFFKKRNQLFVKGSSTINGKENINTEFIYYFNEQKKEMDLALCLKVEQTSIDGVMAYLFSTAAITDSEWLIYDEVGLIARKTRYDVNFDRTFCSRMENSYDTEAFPPSHEKAFNGGVVLYGENVRFPNCVVQGEEDPVCMFYKRVFEGNTLSAKYFGKVNPGKRYFLEGRFQTPIKLGPGIEIRGKLTSVTTSRVGKIVHQKIINIVENSETGKMEIQGRERMHGTLWLSSVQADIPVMLQFVGKSILFKASGVEDDNIGTNILGIANVRAVNVKSQSYPLKLDGPIEAVEFHSRLLIGSSEAHFISVAGGRENTAQYIHGDNSKNKFYACKKSDLNVVLRNLFQAFGATLRLPILDTATVKDACFTYHNGEEPNWEVPNRGFTAERGLRLYGKLHADFGINMPLVVLFEGSAVRMVAELTPLRWGVTKEEVDRKTPQGETIKVQRDVSRIQMTMSEDEEIMGPQLHIEYQNGVYSTGFIEGYIRAPGFEGTGRINIMEDTEGRPTKYEFTHTGLIYGVIEGSLKLAATYTGRNMNEIDFQLEVDLLSKVREKIPDVIQESINEFNEPYDNVVNKLDVDIRKTSELYRTHSTTHNSLRENVDALSARTKKSKLERARSLQAVSKRCARECKPVYMPGLKWENKCTTLKKQKDSRCIKFVKDSHKVSDVGCMAQCESERVKSHAEAIHHDNVARSTIARLSDATECKDLAEFLVNDIQNVKEELERIKTDLATLAKFIHDIKTASQSSAVNILNFASILSAYPIKEAASQPSCLKFRLGYTVTTSEEDTSKEIEMEDKIICFQDEFVKSVTNMALREAYKENYEVLQPKLDAAVKWHSELLGNFYEDVTERGEQLQRCITNSPSPDDDEEKRKRSFIANAKLSPIRSSLFNVMSERTTLMFHKYSPWSVLMKNNPFNEARPAVTKATIEDVTPEDSCLATRHIVQNYQDIVGYMKVWATSLQSGQKTFEKVNDMVGKRLTAVRSAINKMATGDHVLDVHADNMNHWMNVTENGMKKWLDVSSQRLHHLNKDGLKLIKEELSYMYSDKEYKSIDEYIQKKAKKGNNAFKRANIPGKDEKPFSQPSQQLLQIFAKGESLQGVLPIIKEIEAKLVHVDKRSISCHLK